MAESKNHFGFDCRFTRRPPKWLQVECPICLYILRKPYQVTCCGKSFCRQCIKRIKGDGKPCPCCNGEKFNEFPNLGLQQPLYEFRVYCSNNERGCDWTGELGELDNHLNLSPNQDHQLEGCEFSEINCIHCSESIQRLCHEIHIANDCPLTIVECDFHYAGCKVKIPRKDMQSHLHNNLVTHLSLLAISHKELRKENQVLKQRVQDLERDNRVAMNGLCQPPFDIVVDDFQDQIGGLRRTGSSWISRPFYSHPYGYKLCLMVSVPEKYTDNHFSVSLYLMRGEYDHQLGWPFFAVVNIRVISQCKKTTDAEVAFCFHENLPSEITGTVTDVEIATRGVTERLCISSDFYMKGYLTFRVTRVL